MNSINEFPVFTIEIDSKDSWFDSLREARTSSMLKTSEYVGRDGSIYAMEPSTIIYLVPSIVSFDMRPFFTRPSSLILLKVAIVA